MAGSEPAKKARLGQLSETDERRLIEAAQQDRACFGVVYEKYFDLVYAYTARRVGNRAATQEPNQQGFCEAAQQDRACFGVVYEKYFDLVYAYTARRVGNRATTEDLTSEVFRKALESLPRFKWTGAPFGAWLLRIASNLIAARAKRTARED